MKFLTLAELLFPCTGQGWAVGAFNTCNHEITRAIVEDAITEIRTSCLAQLTKPTSTRDFDIRRGTLWVNSF
jgi:fructose/tagatose bisphosphate aldolase